VMRCEFQWKEKKVMKKQRRSTEKNETEKWTFVARSGVLIPICKSAAAKSPEVSFFGGLIGHWPWICQTVTMGDISSFSLAWVQIWLNYCKRVKELRLLFRMLVQLGYKCNGIWGFTFYCPTFCLIAIGSPFLWLAMGYFCFHTKLLVVPWNRPHLLGIAAERMRGELDGRMGEI
jgi:hypothetical protein